MSLSSQLFVSQIHPAVVDWYRKVQTNGGTLPSHYTVRAADRFYKGLVANNLLPMIKCCNIFAPESLTTALTPLICSSSVFNNPWTNTNFVSGDLTINGLIGNSSNKYLNTGIACNSIFSTSNMGVTMYVPENSAGVGHNYGCASNTSYTNDCVATLWVAGAGVFMDSYNTIVTTGGRYTITQVAVWKGLLSMNRTATAVFNAYWHKPAAGFVLAQGPYTSTGGTVPTQPMYAFASNNSTAAAFYSGDRMSFLAFHDGMTFEQASIFYNLIQSLRTEIGGGYV